MTEELETGAGADETEEALRKEVALRAYFKYCERGCAPSCDVDDWLAAEREILAEHAAVGDAVTPERPETSTGVDVRERGATAVGSRLRGRRS